MALVNKFWKSSTSHTPNTRVNIDKVLSFEKIDIIDVNTPPVNTQIGIAFNMDTLNAAPKVIKIMYTSGSTASANQTLRDASVAALDALVTQGTV